MQKLWMAPMAVTKTVRFLASYSGITALDTQIDNVPMEAGDSSFTGTYGNLVGLNQLSPGRD
jgi:hypothetical protein